MIRRSARFVFALLLVLALPAWSGAQGTPYVPLADPAYEDLDALISAGFVRNIIVGERPYSHASFQRFVQEAKPRLDAGKASAYEREAFSRLDARFGMAAAAGSAFGVAPLTTTLALAASPTRAMRVDSMANWHLDADLNTLLQRNEGRILVDGLTASAEGGLTASNSHFALEVTPRVWAGLREGKPSDAGVQLVAGYGRAVWGPLAFDLGRTSYVVGYGPYGGAMQSTNARALDQLRLRTERPVRMPGLLRALGLWQATATVADLGQNRRNAGGTLATLHFTGRPAAYFEWGVTYEGQMSGRGAPPSQQYMRLQEFFLPFRKAGWDYEVIDRVVGAEVRVAVPQSRSAFYVNFLTTDDMYHFTMRAGGYWEDAVWISGFEQRGLGREGRLELRVEGRHSGTRAHSHGQFLSGMTEDRRTIGDAMGPNSEGLAYYATWNGRRARLTLEAATERYSIDAYELVKSPSPRYSWDADWKHVTNVPKEKRQRVMLRWMDRRAWHGNATSVRLGYERILRFNWTEHNRHAAVLEFSLTALR